MCLCAQLFWAHSPHSCIFSSERHSVHARMCARLWGSVHAIACVCQCFVRVRVFRCVYACSRVCACVCVCFGSGLASRMRRLVVSLCVQGRWCERAVRVVLPSGGRV